MQELFGVSAPGGGFLGDANTPGTNDLSDFFLPPPPPSLLSVSGGDDFPRFSAAGWCVAWEPGPSDPVTSHPKSRFPATLAGAGCGSQVLRSRSHRLTHQPDGPLASTHRAPDPVMPRRFAGPIAATAASSRRSPPDCQRTPFRHEVFATSRRSARGRTAPTPLAFILAKFYAFDVSRVRPNLRQKQLS